MKSFLRSGLVFILLMYIPALAGPVGSFCPPGTNPGCMPVPGNKCKSQMCVHIGDPVNIADGNTYVRHNDVSLNTSLGELDVYRTYNSFENLWGYEGAFTDMPRPFGMYNGVADKMRWWHSLYATVYIASPTVWWVRDTDGRVIQYNGCAGSSMPLSTTPCWATNSSQSASITDRLYWTGSSFIFYPASGGQLLFEARFIRPNDGGLFPNVRMRYFLTEIRTSTGQTKATIAYAQPALTPTCPAGNTTYSTPGTPYISTVTTADGTRLTFNYKRLVNILGTGECVLDNVTVLDRASDGGTAEQLAVTYSYTKSGGVERPGLLAAVDLHDRPDAGTETYSYLAPDGGAEFTETHAGTAVVQHVYNSDIVVGTAASLSENMSISWNKTVGLPDGGLCEPGSKCQATGVYTRYVSDNALGAGDGTDAGAGLVRAYVMMTMYPQIHEPRLYEYIDGCSNSMNCSPGTWRWEWDTNNSRPINPLGVKDKRDNWVAYSYADAGVAGFPALREKRVEYRGAQNLDGGAALEVIRNGYVYGANSEQLTDYAEMDSVLGSAGSSARTKNVYDSTTNRRKATIRHGWTSVRDTSGSWVTQERYIGTFYFTSHACESGAADPQGRTLEVHGPCLVSGFNATDCDVDTAGGVPITQYDYWPSTEVSNRVNRMQKISWFTSNGGPGSCSGYGKLETSYNAYDARGNPTSVTDPNGVTTTFTYEEDRVTSQTVSGLTTAFSYDNEKLSSIQSPEGNYEVFCYRTGTSGAGCTGGNWTDKLQWRAKSAVADGSTWSEKVGYTYWPDGTVASETYRAGCSSSCAANSGEIRRVEKHAADAHRRPTWRGWGDATGQFAAASYFDKANNVSGIGLPFNNPPAFCGGPNTAGLPTSTLCSSLGYDRANRLVSVDEYPTSSGAATRTCMEYNAQGHVKDVVTGCSSSAVVGDCSSCTQPSSSYQYDDFGNVVAATLPWLGDSGGAGTTRYEFDAMGNMIKKETPEMTGSGEYLAYAYDILSRPLSVIRYYTQPSSGSETLYALAYDASATLDSSCPQPANTLGRLLYRADSFGKTWYQYDTWGRPTQEIRLRTGATTCSGGLHDNPHTSYTYSSNGNLTSIVYPFGRTVTYNYGTGANVDRVSSLSVTTWNGSSWTTLSNIISGVVWEPYGDLRGYQINHPTSATTSSVEYLLGDDGSTAPIGCPTSVPSSAASDHTGRLRGLWVSTGNFSPGGGSGDIYNRTYTWQADQITRTDTCLLGATTPQTEQYGYDQMLRLTSATRPSGNFAAAGGAFASRGYSYDGRGNRTAQTNDACGYSMTFDTGGRLDRLMKVSSTCTGSLLEYDYTYDKDGRVSQKSTPVDTWGNHPLSMSFVSGPGASGALESVYKSVTVNGSTYSYYYDAFKRRRLKAYPTGVSDEYFHAIQNQMLVDQGNDSITSPASYVDDDYVWLGGRPVVIVRGKFNLSWARQADSSTTCPRNGETAACGVEFPVSDHLWKPVLMLDDQRRVVGVGEYDPFGYVNRVTLDAETPHPYPTNYSGYFLDVTQPVGGTSLSLRMRTRLALQDTEEGCGTPGCSIPYFDEVSFVDGQTAGVLASGFGGRGKAQAWTSWMSPTAGHLKAKLQTGSTNCAPTGSIGDELVDCSASTSYDYPGAIVDAYEYQRFETGATPFWTPLGFPGQYYDAETDLFENWNRYYEPMTDRYLQSEPKLQRPAYLRAMMRRGLGVAVYGYGANNPLAFFDPDGLELRIAWQTRFWYSLLSPKALRRLEDAMVMLNRPGCDCGLKEGSGYSKAPWDDKDIYVQLDPLIGFESFGNADGFSLPYWGVDTMWLQPSLLSGAMASTIAHEAGHFRPPKWGHDENPDRFNGQQFCGAGSAMDDFNRQNYCQCNPPPPPKDFSSPDDE